MLKCNPRQDDLLPRVFFWTLSPTSQKRDGDAVRLSRRRHRYPWTVYPSAATVDIGEEADRWLITLLWSPCRIPTRYCPIFCRRPSRRVVCNMRRKIEAIVHGICGKPWAKAHESRSLACCPISE